MLINAISATEEEEDSDAVISATPKSTKLTGSTFFGPDFNPEAFRSKYQIIF